MQKAKVNHNQIEERTIPHVHFFGDYLSTFIECTMSRMMKLYTKTNHVAEDLKIKKVI